jgi:hypothetical protein
MPNLWGPALRGAVHDIERWFWTRSSTVRGFMTYTAAWLLVGLLTAVAQYFGHSPCGFVGGFAVVLGGVIMPIGLVAALVPVGYIAIRHLPAWAVLTLGLTGFLLLAIGGAELGDAASAWAGCRWHDAGTQASRSSPGRGMVEPIPRSWLLGAGTADVRAPARSGDRCAVRLA